MRDRALAVITTASALSVVAVFLWLTIDIVIAGGSGLHWDFLFGNPEDAGRAGGIAPVVVSTLLILGVCMSVCVPVALATAVYLTEYTGTGDVSSRYVRRILDTLAGVPSVVFGLFGAALFCEILGLGYSIVSGGLTLACMVLPFMIRTAEEALHAIPKRHRLGASALGFSRYGMVTQVLMPIALPGLSIGLIMGIGRALAETAALIFTSGYVLRMPESLLDSGRTLSVHIYDLAMNVSGGESNAYSSALVLVLLLLLINSATHAITRRFIYKAQHQ